MIIKDGVVYRNLQEQVLKNKQDIEEIKESGTSLEAGYGIQIGHGEISIDEQVVVTKDEVMQIPGYGLKWELTPDELPLLTVDTDFIADKQYVDQEVSTKSTVEANPTGTDLPSITTIAIDGQAYVVEGQAGSYTAGNGIVIAGNEIAIDEQVVATTRALEDKQDVLTSSTNIEVGRAIINTGCTIGGEGLGVDGGITATGDITTRQGIIVEGSAVVNGGCTITGYGLSVTGGVAATGNITTQSNISADGTITAGSNITTNGSFYKIDHGDTKEVKPVEVSDTGYASTEAKYITVGDTQWKLPEGGSYTAGNNIVIESLLRTISTSMTPTFDSVETNGNANIGGVLNVSGSIATTSGVITGGLAYETTAPTSNNPYGLRIVYLASEPATKYSGYIYLIAEA